MKIIIYLFLFSFISLEAQVIKITTFDTIEWEHLPTNIKNATFCIIDGKTGQLVSLKSFKDGKKEGLFLYFDNFITLRKIIKEENYKSNILHGYYEDTKESGFYKKGKKNGLWKYYDDMGNYKEISYKNDKKNGQFLSKDGLLEVKGNYKNDLKTGVWITSTKQGIITNETVYKKGTIIKVLFPKENVILK